jgi:hypothetical protein
MPGNRLRQFWPKSQDEGRLEEGNMVGCQQVAFSQGNILLSGNLYTEHNFENRAKDDLENSAPQVKPKW